MKSGVVLIGVTMGGSLAAAAVLAQSPGSSPAAPVQATPAIAAACAGLTSRENGEAFAKFPDAPTAINSARIVPAGGTHGVADNDLPEICRVEGTISPTVGFLLRMPTSDWNGKFMMGGCGGPCGNYLEDRIDHALVRKYAVVTTDMGHKGGGWLFAYNNPQGQLDFAYRATHLTAKVAKELVAAFYGARAKLNYFIGCSTGGRQAMIEAQRFPKDFDGIVAGAPVYDEVGDTPYFLEWNTRVNTASDGSTILTAPKVDLIRSAVLKQCDARDGLKDGLLTNPAACAFDPKSLICKPGQDAAQCLTPEQADVAQKFRDGARNSKGEKLYWGMPWGSEDQWVNYFGWVNPTGKQYAGSGYSITGYVGYAGGPPSGPAFRAADFDYDRDPERLDLTGPIFNPVNPDLSRLRDAGGKLILFHGWNDNNIPVEASIDYYQKAERANGGPAATRQFFRFFTPPGVNHCRGGEGGGEIDWITAIEDWVERGKAPDQVIAYRPRAPYPTAPRAMEDYGSVYSKFGRHPLSPAYYDRARPVYLWPATARYSGRGDPARPENWRKTMP
ncbi:tannase/feruloyl esterase family alpha/beta hydrolase [Sphingomonas sp. SUN019]|uniref:tannase/feruloyl esterase family alpha/beta hydrolase n=1 Tax=Sphingomonas sp. SUN019 TaxID=2937788 RepID=UPI0021649226|nr:tannase/feruloyl esterase family alpha/beta hydrolase [Sphingomonas sp. SUN019]UVO50691.1 tannase/feruloyl esterase family alpha/beta hydrolase [Sphingomonas sp. SUN019]